MSDTEMIGVIATGIICFLAIRFTLEKSVDYIEAKIKAKHHE